MPFIKQKLLIPKSNAKSISSILESLTLDNPEFHKKKRLGLWLGNTPKTIRLFEIDGDNIVLPYGCLRDVYELIPEGWASGFGPINEVDFNEDITNVHLRDYQSKAIQIMYDSKGGVLQSPAGSGKTLIGLMLMFKRKCKALWITHTLDLLNQSKERALEYIDKDLVGTITEGKVNIGKGVTSATVQTLCKLDLLALQDTWDMIIVDECHHVCGSPTTLTQYYKVLNNLAARYKYGITATINRQDGLTPSTFALLGPLMHTVPKSDIGNYTWNAEVHTIYTNFTYPRSCKDGTGRIDYTKLLAYLSTCKERNQLIVDLLAENKNHKNLILSSRLSQLENIIDSLPKELANRCAYVNGSMTSKKGKELRKQVIEDMRLGKIDFLFASYNLAKEGLDIPILDRLYFATPVSDKIVIEQAVGRIERICDGKEQPIVYDIVDNDNYARVSYTNRRRLLKKKGCKIL